MAGYRILSVAQEDSLVIRVPTPHHWAVLEAALAADHANGSVLGVLLAGSLARGTARPDSDIDLLVVTRDPVETPQRANHSGIVVEHTIRTAEGWRERFAPSRPGDESWGYAFLDGVPLHDPDGILARLVADAAAAHAAYRTPADIRAHYLWLWEHGRPKMEATLAGRDGVEIGWAAAVATLPLTETLWAINDRPLPSRDLGCFQRHLDDLEVPPGAPALLRAMLQAPPAAALNLQLQLVDLMLPYLESGGDEMSEDPIGS